MSNEVGYKKQQQQIMDNNRINQNNNYNNLISSQSTRLCDTLQQLNKPSQSTQFLQSSKDTFIQQQTLQQFNDTFSTNFNNRQQQSNNNIMNQQRQQDIQQQQSFTCRQDGQQQFSQLIILDGLNKFEQNNNKTQLQNKKTQLNHSYHSKIVLGQLKSHQQSPLGMPHSRAFSQSCKRYKVKVNSNNSGIPKDFFSFDQNNNNNTNNTCNQSSNTYQKITQKNKLIGVNGNLSNTNSNFNGISAILDQYIIEQPQQSQQQSSDVISQSIQNKYKREDKLKQIQQIQDDKIKKQDDSIPNIMNYNSGGQTSRLLSQRNNLKKFRYSQHLSNTQFNNTSSVIQNSINNNNNSELVDMNQDNNTVEVIQDHNNHIRTPKFVDKMIHLNSNVQESINNVQPKQTKFLYDNLNKKNDFIKKQLIKQSQQTFSQSNLPSNNNSNNLEQNNIQKNKNLQIDIPLNSSKNQDNNIKEQIKNQNNEQLKNQTNEQIKNYNEQLKNNKELEEQIKQLNNVSSVESIETISSKQNQTQSQNNIYNKIKNKLENDNNFINIEDKNNKINYFDNKNNNKNNNKLENIQNESSDNNTSQTNESNKIANMITLTNEFIFNRDSNNNSNNTNNNKLNLMQQLNTDDTTTKNDNQINLNTQKTKSNNMNVSNTQKSIGLSNKFITPNKFLQLNNISIVNSCKNISNNNTNQIKSNTNSNSNHNNNINSNYNNNNNNNNINLNSTKTSQQQFLNYQQQQLQLTETNMMINQMQIKNILENRSTTTSQLTKRQQLLYIQGGLKKRNQLSLHEDNIYNNNNTNSSQNKHSFLPTCFKENFNQTNLLNYNNNSNNLSSSHYKSKQFIISSIQNNQLQLQQHPILRQKSKSKSKHELNLLNQSLEKICESNYYQPRSIKRDITNINNYQFLSDQNEFNNNENKMNSNNIDNNMNKNNQSNSQNYIEKQNEILPQIFTTKKNQKDIDISPSNHKLKYNNHVYQQSQLTSPPNNHLQLQQNNPKPIDFLNTLSNQSLQNQFLNSPITSFQSTITQNRNNNNNNNISGYKDKSKTATSSPQNKQLFQTDHYIFKNDIYSGNINNNNNNFNKGEHKDFIKIVQDI